MHSLRIGISGWLYAPWRGVFYPKGLPQNKELAFASSMFPSIEINGSFYNLQRPQSYARWYQETPDDFVFSVKAPRYITHILRLNEVKIPMANFFASGVFNLREKLGPILWQFPPSFRFDPALFEEFLRLLPHNTEQASKLARKHDDHVKGRAKITPDAERTIRHAVEIRNKSFIDERFVELLRQYKAALVVADTAGKWPYVEDLTSDFVYMRLHGDEELYASGYTDAALKRWADRIQKWEAGTQPDDAQLISAKAPAKRAKRSVYCYFDNDVKVKAPFDAAKLLQRLGQKSPLLSEDAQLGLLSRAR
ncbi:MAG TPA: DUF72 domain-containing protein [Dongiaceae bacterium]|nr:DUF72 domain-containing protein [Dongiaceae bacterium]